MKNKKEYIAACVRIAEPSYEFMMKKINKEIRNIGDKNKEVNINIVTGLIIQSICSVDVNILRTVRAMYQKFDPKNKAYIELMTLYFAQLLEQLHDDAGLVMQNLSNEFISKKTSKVN